MALPSSWAGSFSAEPHADAERSKTQHLDEIVSRWFTNDPTELPWIHSIADESRAYDDHDQLVAGLDLLLDGLVRHAIDHAGNA